MRFQEISERCWTGYQQQGMKRKGDRMVPNCVPVAEVKTGPEMTLNDLLYTAAAKAMHQAGLEGQPMDYEEAIKKAAKIYRIPYTPSELPKLLAQRAEIDRKLAMLKQGKQIAKARRQEKLAPTPAGAEEYWQTHALPTDRIKPPTRTLEAVDPFLDNTARELLSLVLIAGGAFAVGTYYTIVNKLKKYQGRQIIDALERKGVKFNRETYDKVQPLLTQFRQALQDNEGEQAKQLAKRIEQTIVMGKLSAKEPQTSDSALAAKERKLAEDLKKWFKEKWVRFGPDGKIRGDCARGSEGEGKPKCLPQAKAHALGKAGRASAAAKKRREDPNPERRGAARNVATKVKEGFEYGNQVQHPKYGTGQIIKVYPNGMITVNFPNYPDPIDKKPGVQGNFAPGNSDYQSLKPVTEAQTDYQKRRQRERDVDAGKPVRPLPKNPKTDYQKRREQERRDMELGEEQIDEKQDACYRKVKSRYKVWPSAYASGALVQCRKKGAANWGNKGKK